MRGAEGGGEDERGGREGADDKYKMGGRACEDKERGYEVNGDHRVLLRVHDSLTLLAL